MTFLPLDGFRSPHPPLYCSKPGDRADSRLKDRAVSGGSIVKRIILALVVGFGGALFAAAPAVSADTPPTVTPTLTTPGTPVVITGTTDAFSTTATATSRRGILSRFRDRRSGPAMTTAPQLETGTIVTPSPSITIPSTIIPTPMPKPAGVTPASGTLTSTPMVTTAAYTTVSSQPARTGLFSRNRSRTTTAVVPASVVAPMTMPMNVVVPASATVAMMPMTSSSMMMTSATMTTSSRMGLLSRMRARR